MLIGIINNETANEHYYIHLDKEDNYNAVSIIHTSENAIEYLSREKTKELVKTLLSSNLTFKEKENDYDVYLDEANNRRYFKDGKENYLMFLENNGTDALHYFEKINKNASNQPKSYKIIARNTVFFMVLSSVILTPFIGEARLLEPGKRLISATVPLSISEMENLMKLSPYISDEDKEYLCDSEYLKFVLSYSKTQDRNYSLREKLHNIDIKYYDQEKKPELAGFYSDLKPNCIYLSKDYGKDNDQHREVMTHEFIHLTQTNSEYNYIIEGSAEILKDEFYYTSIYGYNSLTVRLKVLMEIIGPDPILKCVFTGDNTSLEKEVKSYLSEEDAKEMLSMLSSKEIYTVEGLQKVNEKIDSLLGKMYEKKNNEDMSTDAMIKKIYDYKDKGRIYFNTNLENYYKDFRLPDVTKYIGNCEIDDVLNSGNVESYTYEIYTNTDEANGFGREYKTIVTKDYSSIPFDHIGSLYITFKDGTFGHYSYNSLKGEWLDVTRFKVVEKYEPSIAKKFPKENKELESMIDKEKSDDTNMNNINKR